MQSLIKSDDNQLKLFGSDQMDPAFFSAEESGPTPEFTGERLFSAKPETYRAIAALSAEGLSIRRIGRILHVSPNTVLSVRAHEPETIDADKRRLASLSREGARMCIEGIIEMLCDPDQVKKMTIKDKGIVFGILSEKSELLSGSPTARLQTIGSPPAVEVIEYLSWLRSEYARRTGLGEGKKGENGGYQDTDRVEIVEHGAPCKPNLLDSGSGLPDSGPEALDPAKDDQLGPADDRQAAPGASLPAPEGSVGQTPHRLSETPINIESNEGGENGVDLIPAEEIQDGKASA